MAIQQALINSMMIDISIHDVPGEERDRETVRREVDRRISQSTRPVKGATGAAFQD